MKTKQLILTLTMGLFTVFAFSQFTSTLMEAVGTAHNFATGTGTNDAGNTGTNYTFALNVVGDAGNGVCAVCHTPHNSQSVQYPLWDHDASASVFTLYDSGTLDGTTIMAGSGSQLCLGCHDGTANLDSYGKSETTGGQMVVGDAYANFGTVLSDDHPIAISYPFTAAAAAEQMVDPAILIADTGWLYGSGTATTGVLTVECASCHSMHNPVVIPKLLRETNDNSALCLTCHVK